MKPSPDQDARYLDAAAEHGGALQRLARATEANAERRRDLLQDMHVELWRSFASYDARCSVRTWVYRVAHNVAASHVDRERRSRAPFVPLDEIDQMPSGQSISNEVEESEAVSRLHTIIRQLGPPERQIITLYLEGLDAASIADVTGLSAGAIATRVSRLKTHLARVFQETANV